jgi:hypothetical protein
MTGTAFFCASFYVFGLATHHHKQQQSVLENMTLRSEPLNMLLFLWAGVQKWVQQLNNWAELEIFFYKVHRFFESHYPAWYTSNAKETKRGHTQWMQVSAGHDRW